MTIDDMYRVRQIIDCSVCGDKELDLCRKLLTPEQRNSYAEKYGCICGCECKCCLNRRECVMTISIELTAGEVSFIKDIVSDARDGYSDARGELDSAEEVVTACDKVLKALENYSDAIDGEEALENGVSDDNT